MTPRKRPALTAIVASVVEVRDVDLGIPANHALADQHRVRLIPTRVFLDVDGHVRFRHEGSLSE